jgi:hypothetical protein
MHCLHVFFPKPKYFFPKIIWRSKLLFLFYNRKMEQKVSFYFFFLKKEEKFILNKHNIVEWSIIPPNKWTPSSWKWEAYKIFLGKWQFTYTWRFSPCLPHSFVLSSNCPPIFGSPVWTYRFSVRDLRLSQFIQLFP